LGAALYHWWRSVVPEGGKRSSGVTKLELHFAIVIWVDSEA
jgi:hypothetical protein